MQPYEIETKTTVSQTDRSPFELALGQEAFTRLPEALKRFHSPSGAAVWSGIADVNGGQWFAPKMIARLFGFPATGRNIPVTVTIDRTQSKHGAAVESWTRCFAGKRMTSHLRHLDDDTITEQFAPFTFSLALEADVKGLRMPVLGWRLGPIRLPKFLAPRSETLEYMDDEGRFRFDVRLSAPLIGLLAHYRGWLEPVQD